MNIGLISGDEEVVRYRSIARWSIQLRQKQTIKQQLLALDNGDPAQEKVLVRVIQILLQFRHAVAKHDFSSQARALAELKQVVISHPRQLPDFQSLLCLVKNRSYCFQRPICRSLHELIEQLSAPVQLAVCAPQVQFLLANGVKLRPVVKNCIVRAKLCTQAIRNYKREALDFYREQVIPRICALATNTQRQQVIYEILLFHQVCNLIQRQQINQALSLADLQSLASSIFQRLNLTYEPYFQLLFVSYSVIVNLHRHSGLLFKQVLKGLLLALVAGASAAATVLSLGLLEIVLTTLQANHNNPPSARTQHLVYAGLSYGALVGIILTLASFKALVLTLPLALRTAQRSVTKLKQINSGDALNSTTATFEQLCQLFAQNCSADFQGLAPGVVQQLLVVSQNLPKHEFMQTVRNYFDWECIVEHLLFNDAESVAEAVYYLAYLQSSSARSKIEAASQEYASVMDPQQFNLECRINGNKFTPSSRVVGVLDKNGKIILVEYAELLSWIAHASYWEGVFPPTGCRLLLAKPQLLI